MADIAQGMRFKIDLDAGLVQRPQREILMRNDKNANKIIIEVTRKGYMETVNLNGVSVVGEFVRQSGERVPLTGSTSGNVATVLLNAHCYVETGRFEAFIRFKMGDAMRTVLYISGNVSKDADGPVVDTEDVIPSLDELLAQLGEMRQVTDAANTATLSANKATTDANNAAGNANAATEEAYEAASRAYTATKRANDAAQSAEAATESANAAANGANASRIAADAAAGGANEAASRADAATQSANEAAASAREAAGAAREATEGIDAKINTRLGGLSFAVNADDGGLDIIYTY